MSSGTPRTISGRIESKEAGVRLSIYAAIRTSGADVTGFLDILAHAVNNEIWKNLQDKAGNELTFRQFIEAPYPVGVGSSVEEIKKIALLKSRHERNPETAAKLASMRRAVDDLANEALPAHGEIGRGRGKDRIPTSTGNLAFDLPRAGRKQEGRGRDYELRRLKRDRPDLAAKVIGGELSANDATIAAGFKHRRVSVPADDPEAAARTLLKCYGRDGFARLVEAGRRLRSEPGSDQRDPQAHRGGDMAAGGGG